MRALAALVAVILCPTVLAAEPSDAQFKSLASLPRWHALLHINPGATMRGIGESYADDPDFFLAPNGKRDPVAELRATWKALKAPDSQPDSQKDTQTRCHFPARYRFLAEHLGWHASHPLARCTKYKQWRKKMPAGRLVLVFPSAYLNSPSSMFGHTLLRLDSSSHPASVWLSRAINFGAQTGGQDNSILYIWKGLAGGYEGRFSVETYAKKIREYAFLENRDMWEYKLNLDKDELDWFLRHLWELHHTNFDYYFFDENCAFRLLELLKVARPNAPLLAGFRFAQLPLNTVRTLYKSGLVRSRHYRPSKERRLKHLEHQLSPAQTALAQKLARDPKRATTAQFKQYPPEQRHLMAQVAYRALRLESRASPRTAADARDSLALLRIVQRNAAPTIPRITAPPPPTSGHKTQMFTLGGGDQDGNGFATVSYRLTYHDILDPLSGYLPGAGIEGLNIRLRETPGHGLHLENLDLINIRSLAPRGPFVKPVSWFVHTGFEQVPTDDERNLGFFLQGGPGATWQIGHFLPYTFAVARAETVHEAETAAAIGGGLEIGSVYLTRGVQLGAKARVSYFTHDFYRFRASLTADVPITTNNAVRARCSHESWRNHGFDSCRLELRHYFN